MPRWAAYFTALGVIGSLLFGWIQSQPQLCAMGVGAPICLRPLQESGDDGSVQSEDGRSSSYALDQLPAELRAIVQAARDAQRSGVSGAREARAAAARADEAAQRARSRRPGLGFSRSSNGGEWFGEALAPNAIVYGVRSENGIVARGEFHVSGTSPHLRLAPRLYVIAFNDGQFEGRSNEADQWIGPGRFMFADGGRYEGVWRPSATVSGVLTLGDGRRYEGQFRDVARTGFDLVQDGRGVLWSADGRVIDAGVWRDGAYVGAE
jgi:hypothetical protein